MSRRVLVVTHNYPRFQDDPAGAFVARLAWTVADAGWEVQVVAPHSPATQERERDNGVEVTRFRYASERWERVAFVGDVSLAALLHPARVAVLPLFWRGFRRAVDQAVADWQPSVVHAHWWIPAGWIASQTGCPYLVTSHGSDVRLIERSVILRARARRVLAQAGRVTAVSDFLARDLERLIRADKRAVLVTRMPIDVERYGQGLKFDKVAPPRILYAGNLVASKGVDVLLEAIAVLKQRGVACNLRVLGEGPEAAPLKLLAARFGITEMVEWSDFVDQGRMPDEYGRSSVTVLPSRGKAEGLGLTLVEALLAGCSVVGTRVGGIPEVVQHEHTGLLAKEDDPLDLADQLERLLADDDLRRRLTASGHDRVRELHAPEQTAAVFMELYSDLAQHH
jgi:glycosyltransferase involved in cell wall biosynthesis